MCHSRGSSEHKERWEAVDQRVARIRAELHPHTLDTWGWTPLCFRDRPAHHKMVSSIPGLYPLTAGVSSPAPSCENPNVSRCSQMTPTGAGAAELPLRPLG